MILSFHPIIDADKNMLCAGRPPDSSHLEAIRRAQAVILPQGSSEALYRMARSNCPNVFPNLDVRFKYPGKLAQIRLFSSLGIPHPDTRVFDGVHDFGTGKIPFPLPWVIKLSCGGQGDGVWLVKTPEEMTRLLGRLKKWEITGQSGFLIQQKIEDRDRSLRVTVIGKEMVSYWRIRTPEQPFGTGVAHGANIDFKADPTLRLAAEDMTRHICGDTGLQLAGFDFLFNEEDLRREQIRPLILEINYFFGRTGLGGSHNFYRILTSAVDSWLAGLGLSR